MKFLTITLLSAFTVFFNIAQVRADCAADFKKCTAEMTAKTANMSHGSQMGHQSECAAAHFACDVKAQLPTYGIFSIVPSMVIGHLSWLNDNLWKLGEVIVTPRPGNSNYK